MAKTKAPKPKKLRQQHLPGTEPLSNKKIDSAAHNYEDARDERMARSKDEKDAKNTLLFAMTEAGIDRYETPDGLVVTVSTDKEVKVAKAKGHEQNGEADA
jgi:hypothetical protein